MKLDKYYIRARLFPSILTAIPAIVLYYSLIGTQIASLVNYVIAVPILFHVTVSIALVYAFTLINRFLGKEIFQRLYFKDEAFMPTTNYLLSTNSVLSQDMKKKIKQKAQADFSIRLPSADDETRNIDDARKQIIFAVSQIRNKTRGNRLLLQHNYEYGFIRNFLGGSVLAILTVIGNLIIFKFYVSNLTAFKISIGLGVIYFLFIFLSKWIINRHAHMYAKVLFEQYLIRTIS